MRRLQDPRVGRHRLGGDRILELVHSHERPVQYTTKDGTPRLQHNVQADEIGVSFRGQDVHVPGKQQPAE